MKEHALLTIVALYTASLTAVLCRPAIVRASPQCFSLKQWTGPWKGSQDNQSVYIRLQSGQVYRLQLDGTHPLLKDPFAILVHRQPDSMICGPRDFDLTLSNRVGTREALVVRQMTLLTLSEAAALPRDERP
jgi:hypothetical protein